MKYKAVFSQESREDAKSIQLYLRQFSQNAPSRFKDTLRDKINKVKENPHMYEPYRYQPKYHSIPIEKYLLFNEVDDKQKIIYVFRILHGAQDTPSYL